MRIGIDARTILDPKNGEPAGVGQYTYNLLRALLAIDRHNEYVLFFDRPVEPAKSLRKKNSRFVYFPLARHKKYLPYVYSHMLTASALRRERLDVFHSPASTIPLRYQGKAVVTIHDMAIYINQQWFPRQGFATKVAVPRSLKQAKAVIAVSQSTKQDIVELLQIPAAKIRVVYNGVEEAERFSSASADALAKFAISKPFMLFIGTIEPRKNITGILQALDELRGTAIFKNYQLVIAGKKGWFYNDIFRSVRELGLTKKVIFTGYVSKQEKYVLLNQAELFLFPSLYEGFGLSVLEAMREGTPVITSSISSMPEVAGEAGYLVDPGNTLAIGRAIKQVLADKVLREEMIKKGKEQVKKFNWEKCAKETLEIYNQVNSSNE